MYRVSPDASSPASMYSLRLLSLSLISEGLGEGYWLGDLGLVSPTSTHHLGRHN